MITSAFLSLVYGFINILTLPINLPNFSDAILDILEEIVGYMQAGVGIIANYTDFGYLLSLFGIVLAIDIGIKIYKFVMWVLRKIPVLGSK